MNILNLQGVINNLNETKSLLSSLAAEAYRCGESQTAADLWTQESEITHRLEMVGKIEEKFNKKQNKDKQNELISTNFDQKCSLCQDLQ